MRYFRYSGRVEVDFDAGVRTEPRLAETNLSWISEIGFATKLGVLVEYAIREEVKRESVKQRRTRERTTGSMCRRTPEARATARPHPRESEG